MSPPKLSARMARLALEKACATIVDADIEAVIEGSTAPADALARRTAIRTLTEAGHTPVQIARALDIHPESVRRLSRAPKPAKPRTVPRRTPQPDPVVDRLANAIPPRASRVVLALLLATTPGRVATAATFAAVLEREGYKSTPDSIRAAICNARRDAKLGRTDLRVVYGAGWTLSDAARAHLVALLGQTPGVAA